VDKVRLQELLIGELPPEKNHSKTSGRRGVTALLMEKKKYYNWGENRKKEEKRITKVLCFYSG